MKKFNAIRKRGFTLIEITLVLAVGLGLIVGGLMFFQQAQSGSEVTDKTRAMVSVSSEIRAQYRTAAQFPVLTDPSSEVTSIKTRSGLPAATFNDMTITNATAGQNFTLTLSNLTASVCERLSIADLGPKSTATCATGTLTVVYAR